MSERVQLLLSDRILGMMLVPEGRVWNYGIGLTQLWAPNLVRQLEDREEGRGWTAVTRGGYRAQEITWSRDPQARNSQFLTHIHRPKSTSHPIQPNTTVSYIIVTAPLAPRSMDYNNYGNSEPAPPYAEQDPYPLPGDEHPPAYQAGGQLPPTPAPAPEQHAVTIGDVANESTPAGMRNTVQENAAVSLEADVGVFVLARTPLPSLKKEENERQQVCFLMLSMYFYPSPYTIFLMVDDVSRFQRSPTPVLRVQPHRHQKHLLPWHSLAAFVRVPQQQLQAPRSSSSRLHPPAAVAQQRQGTNEWEQLTSMDPYNTTVFVGGLSPLVLLRSSRIYSTQRKIYPRPYTRALVGFLAHPAVRVWLDAMVCERARAGADCGAVCALVGSCVKRTPPGVERGAALAPTAEPDDAHLCCWCRRPNAACAAPPRARTCSTRTLQWGWGAATSRAQLVGRRRMTSSQANASTSTPPPAPLPAPRRFPSVREQEAWLAGEMGAGRHPTAARIGVGARAISGEVVMRRWHRRQGRLDLEPDPSSSSLAVGTARDVDMDGNGNGNSTEGDSDGETVRGGGGANEQAPQPYTGPAPGS
ncbi:hypothetical protein B0H14DRAFT_3727612 [Mycena olivaceomarginata]|nr:hypothetical protein B0H14DRAFT_3727612 [Mycena olivaceomarginata]